MATATRKTAKTTAKKASKKASKTKPSKRVGKRKTARNTATPRRASAKRTKDPRGGLTAAGRAAFRRRDGSKLKPGVTKKVSEMTPQEMRRKGSWAVRFYGRAKLPPLVDKTGAPTRHALSAHAWGEPVPTTVAAARKIAEKGHKLLDRYERLQEHGKAGTAAKRKSSAPRSTARKTTARKSTARKGTARKVTRKSPARRARKAA